MADNIRITIVQQSSSLRPEENRAAVAAVDSDADLVVFPEAFARDFGKPGDDISEFAEPHDGPFSQALNGWVGAGQTVVAGMFEASEDPDRPFNTLLVRGATEASYRKIHLYDSFGYLESDRLTAGPWTPTLIDVHGFRVGLMTCYDLRFPELARALVDLGADVLVVPAAWVPGRSGDEHARKIDHWTTLVRARAIENTTYVVAAGQAAPRYTGHSLVVAPSGDVVAQALAEPTELSATLSRALIDEVRRTNPSLANRRLEGR
ncbi:MAG: carbon-nitrogen hydrolase family protein [Nocardioides sp.]|nr:carbon-nitrogen hydrolase family protein [Nocardioides sp.]